MQKQKLSLYINSYTQSYGWNVELRKTGLGGLGTFRVSDEKSFIKYSSIFSTLV